MSQAHLDIKTGRSSWFAPSDRTPPRDTDVIGFYPRNRIPFEIVAFDSVGWYCVADGEEESAPSFWAPIPPTPVPYKSITSSRSEAA